MKKEYKVTEEIEELFIEIRAADDCRDSAVESLFFSKRAINYAKQAVRAREKAWNLVYDLYPELSGKNLTYIYSKRVVVERE